MKPILLATKNPAKQEKLRWILEGLDVAAAAAPDWVSQMPAVVEEGTTHQENAERKARMWSRWSGGMMTIATDGGLAIPALGERWEALRTGRFAGEGATDLERLDALLEMMRPHAGEERAAYWLEAMAVAEKGRILQSWSVQSQPGLLATEYDSAAIKPGFWAFSLWYLPELGKSYNQLSGQELERLDDHWGRLRGLVRELITPSGPAS